LLYARVGEAYSYNTGKKMVKFSEEEIVQSVFKKYNNKKISLLAPLVRGRKGHYRELFEDIRKKGFLKVRVDGEVMDLAPRMQVDRYKIHDIEVVVDRLQVTEDMKLRLSQSVQKSLQIGKDLLFILINDNNELAQYSKQLMCIDTGISYEEPSPNAFSFNSPYGACAECNGLGTKEFFSNEACPECKGARLREEALFVKIDGKNIVETTAMSIENVKVFFENIKLSILKELLESIKARYRYKKSEFIFPKFNNLEKLKNYLGNAKTFIVFL
jgi:excinuclease ABC subunit A